MKIHITDLKAEMERDGVKMLDFLENNFKLSYRDPNLQIARVFLIEEKHLCRPDLISWESYNSVDYVDMILKFNQISNPFSMDLDDFIIVPSMESGLRFYQQDRLRTSKFAFDTKSLFIDPTKASQKDMARLKQLEKIAKRRQNGATEIKPTNLLRNGEVPYTTDGNVLILAPSVSVNTKNSQAI